MAAHTPDISEQEIEQRRNEVWRLRLRGKSIRDIATELGSSPSTVHRDIDAVTKQLRDDTQGKAERYREVELGRLDDLYSRGIERLELEAQEGVEPEASAPLLNALRGISERRAKLLGLDAPAETINTNLNENTEATPERARQLMVEKFGRVSITGAGTDPDEANAAESTSADGSEVTE